MQIPPFPLYLISILCNMKTKRFKPKCNNMFMFSVNDDRIMCNLNKRQEIL